MYPFFIGRRNNMTVINAGKCGNTITNLQNRPNAFSIEKYRTIPEDAEDFGVRLSFCLFCERLYASLLADRTGLTLKEAAALAVTISEEIEYSDDNTALLMG